MTELPDQPADTADEQQTPLRVLLVEDNEINRKVISCILNMIQADLTWAENGLEGVQAFQQQSFDVVLMDLQMPVMDGYTATREIRAYESSRGGQRTPIIVVSANVRPEDLSASRAAGADNHLGKPVDVTALFAAMQEALAAAQAETGSGEAQAASA
ncbi:MAG TPA: response regulator [Caulobacteraceae bacterium]|jgi:CheY-like chemotaxis protein